MKTFLEFAFAQHKETEERLNLVKKILEKDGLRVDSFLSESKPYIFCFNPLNNLDFEGIRIFENGQTMSFQVCKTKETLPYGLARALDINDLFNQICNVEAEKKEATETLVKEVALEIRKFFKHSKFAEDELMGKIIDGQSAGDKAGSIVVRNTGTDYSNQVYSKNGFGL
jgi:hypothetical protein